MVRREKVHASCAVIGATIGLFGAFYGCGRERGAAGPGASDTPPEAVEIAEPQAKVQDAASDSEPAAGPAEQAQEPLGPGDEAALQALARAKRVPEREPSGVRFAVVERGPGQPWALAVANQGEQAVRLIADPRLLWFEVTVPSKKKPVACRLPDTLFPSSADRRSEVVLEPGEAVVHSFDPRLYCFASGGQTALVPGAFVAPHFGWKGKHAAAPTKPRKGAKKKPGAVPPFVLTPASVPGVENWRADQDTLCENTPPEPEKPNAAKPAAGAKTQTDKKPEVEVNLEETPRCVKELEAEPFAMRSEYKAWSSTRLDEDRPMREKPGPLELELTQGSDALAERTATVTLRLKNRAARPRNVYFRRELVSFEVMTPDGPLTCDAQPDERAPDRQAFLRLNKGGSMAVTSRLIELCPRGAFGRPGLYIVHARFDAIHSGDEYGLEAFVGRVVTVDPATVRVRTGDLPFLRKSSLKRVDVGASEAAPAK